MIFLFDLYSVNLLNSRVPGTFFGIFYIGDEVLHLSKNDFFASICYAFRSFPSSPLDGSVEQCVQVFYLVLYLRGKAVSLSLWSMALAAVFFYRHFKLRRLPFMTIWLHVFIVNGSLNFVKRLLCIFRDNYVFISVY